MLRKIQYCLFVVPIVYIPTPFLYGISNLLRFVMDTVVGYRKKVITENIKNSFPSYSEQKIKETRKDFYKHFTDVLLENLLFARISKKQLKKRYHVTNPEVLNQLYNKGKSAIILSGHFGNWEWLCGLPQYIKHPTKALYKVQSNKFADWLMRKTRSRFGVEVVPMEGTNKSFMSDRNTCKAFIFVADQSPPRNAKNYYWINFLNQETAVLPGAEKLCKLFKQALVYTSVTKPKRGHYEITFKLISEDATTLPEGELTRLHTKALEEDIIRQPEIWLWSHRRWKIKKEHTNV
jgi:KDO2-lipid IV(A) lauroyltransferase